MLPTGCQAGPCKVDPPAPLYDICFFLSLYEACVMTRKGKMTSSVASSPDITEKLVKKYIEEHDKC